MIHIYTHIFKSIFSVCSSSLFKKTLPLPTLHPLKPDQASTKARVIFHSHGGAGEGSNILAVNKTDTSEVEIQGTGEACKISFLLEAKN